MSHLSFRLPRESSSQVLKVFCTSGSSNDSTDLGARHSIGNPIHIYPLYENGFRARRGQSIVENNKESAELYSHFSMVAAEEEFAWSYGKRPMSAKQIGTVSKQNRMICFPCEYRRRLTLLVINHKTDPLLMNAFNNVNMAAVTLVTSVAMAKQLKVPQSKWIYPLGGAGTKDSDDCMFAYAFDCSSTNDGLVWLRPDFFSSPSISRSLDAALAVSNAKQADIDLFDFYS